MKSIEFIILYTRPEWTAKWNPEDPPILLVKLQMV